MKHKLLFMNDNLSGLLVVKFAKLLT